MTCMFLVEDQAQITVVICVVASRSSHPIVEPPCLNLLVPYRIWGARQCEQGRWQYCQRIFWPYHCHNVPQIGVKEWSLAIFLQLEKSVFDFCMLHRKLLRKCWNLIGSHLRDWDAIRDFWPPFLQSAACRLVAVQVARWDKLPSKHAEANFMRLFFFAWASRPTSPLASLAVTQIFWNFEMPSCKFALLAVFKICAHKCGSERFPNGSRTVPGLRRVVSTLLGLFQPVGLDFLPWVVFRSCPAGLPFPQRMLSVAGLLMPVEFTWVWHSLTLALWVFVTPTIDLSNLSIMFALTSTLMWALPIWKWMEISILRFSLDLCFSFPYLYLLSRAWWIWKNLTFMLWYLRGFSTCKKTSAWTVQNRSEVPNITLLNSSIWFEMVRNSSATPEPFWTVRWHLKRGAPEPFRTVRRHFEDPISLSIFIRKLL